MILLAYAAHVATIAAFLADPSPSWITVAALLVQAILLRALVTIDDLRADLERKTREAASLALQVEQLSWRVAMLNRGRR
jgi:hypothetical protein